MMILEVQVKIAFDIGGVLSKYPDEFRLIMDALRHNDNCEPHDIYIITDQHPKEQVIKILTDNKFIGYYDDLIKPENVYCSNYSKYGEMCKAVLLHDLKIDIFVDDFPGYLNWDYRWGKPPLRLFVWPDASREYHHPDWIQDKSYTFGKEKWNINE